MKILFISVVMSLLTACASSINLPKDLTQLNASNPLACRFNKQTVGEKTSQENDWYFWRTAERTETRDKLSNQGEIWERNQNGQLFYTRLFFNEKVALEFTAGDLAATDATPSWQQISSLVDSRSLGKELALLSEETIEGMVVQHYQGTVNKVATELDWLPNLQLPTRLSKTLPAGVVTLSLAECGNPEKFAVKPLSKFDFDKLRRLDYTDLGDMEDDPVVRHLEQLMGGHHHSEH